MKTLDNLRMVSFTAYVCEDEAHLIESELVSLSQRSEATLARGNVEVQTAHPFDREAQAALAFFQELDESDAEIDRQIAADGFKGFG